MRHLILSCLLTLPLGCAGKPSQAPGAPAAALTPEQEAAWRKWLREVPEGERYAVALCKASTGTWRLLSQHAPGWESAHLDTLYTRRRVDEDREQHRALARQAEHSAVAIVDVRAGGGPRATLWYRDGGDGVVESGDPPTGEMASSLADFLARVQRSTPTRPYPQPPKGFDR